MELVFPLLQFGCKELNLKYDRQSNVRNLKFWRFVNEILQPYGIIQWTSLSSGEHSCLIVGRSQVQFSAPILVILVEDTMPLLSSFVAFLSRSRQITESYLKLVTAASYRIPFSWSVTNQSCAPLYRVAEIKTQETSGGHSWTRWGNVQDQKR